MNKKVLYTVITILFLGWVGVVVALVFNQESESGDTSNSTVDNETTTDSDSNTESGEGSIELTKKTYVSGETVEFTLSNYLVEYCSDFLPYQITDSEGESLNIKHSCAGIVGRGVDLYCQAGEIIVENTDDRCSDAIDCGVKKVSGTFSWDQNIFWSIQEECQGKTISHEESSLVPSGTYHVLITDADGQVTKEKFTIISKARDECNSDSDCAIGGCSSEVCGVKGLVESVVSPCLARPYYECYQYTSCGCVSGQCKWKDNPNFDKCFLEKGNK